MGHYLARRLLLLPITLFCIILVNFVIVNLAPGDPVSVTEVSQEGNAIKREDASAFGSDERHLQFREHYGLTLPILFNTWPWITADEVWTTLELLADKESLPFEEYDALRIRFGDQARFIMPLLLAVIEDERAPDIIRRMATRFFVRGGTRQAILGPNLTEAERAYNKQTVKDNTFFGSVSASSTTLAHQTAQLRQWYNTHAAYYHFEPTGWDRIVIFFSETRFFRYFSRIITLDFGTLRYDSNKLVTKEVAKRFKYSLTLSVVPMLLTFIVSQFLGFLMAYTQDRWQDVSLRLLFLVLYAVPIFVVAPFLIEKVAVNGHFPFTDTPIPLSGFSSPEAQYEQLLSYQRLLDVIQHISLPMIAIIYGTLAVKSRLARTAVLEVWRQDYVRTAQAKGVGNGQLLFKHVGRNAAITIVTALASSLGVILGGSLVVETLFEIDGFGKFFYDAILNRDYNVIMFSTLAAAFLSLVGFLIADITYTILDPRVTLE